MKIHRVVQMLGATTSTGKLADDMYDLNHKTYYSKAEDKDIPISHMDFQHLVRAFVKQNDEDVRTDTQEGKVKDLDKQVKHWKKKYDALRETYAILFDSAEVKDKKHHQQMENADNQLMYQEKIIEGLRSEIKTWKEEEHRWRKAYHDEHNIQGHRYVFCEIPNDEYGKKLTRGMKVYLNDESYTMRVRGQHIKPEFKGTNATSYGQSIEQSTHLRVYIDKRKETNNVA
jgi:hypothetical protein